MKAPAMLEREAALCIGLAARALPEIGVRGLLEVLLGRFGAPLSQAALAKVTVADLKTLPGLEDLSVEQLTAAAACLRGEGEEAELEPPIQPYAEGDMPGSIRVACASNGGDHVDGHFASCSRFLIYQVLPDELRLIAVREAVPEEPEPGEDKHAKRAALIADCHLLYLLSIGGPAAAKVVKRGVHPVRLREARPAEALLGELQGVMRGAPPPWLAKIMGQPPEARVRFERETEAPQ
ncbi:hypothetical protein BJI67_04220 [Acidihalobacter aeolianus]|uniref:Dinitrogenase iron-molybdenum cofactor biosynthesis protein n=1 Tax=Acidihalobacter aeolianus TaxID=2792603 RepID=A0A1D8K5Y7_9GAMM|nr:dinitrogenase iron-molybdenum cofactor biosynthesis protein [Acidihalobacter aeolianus]AOV16378.1 hypothetical protein BJI67_04220 [Acidihalobacter aeolianus]